MNTDVLTNGLKVSVDWLAFTVHAEHMTILDVMRFLGLDPSLFSPAPRGANGYKSMLNLDGYALSILSDGNENMGIHVNIGGSAVGHILECYMMHKSDATPFGSDAFETKELGMSVLTNFLSDVRTIGSIARLDLALDDVGTVHFTIDDLQGYLDNHQVLSKFRKYTNHVSRKVNNNDLVGGTLYFGSGQSDVRLRIYDKQMEYNAKHSDQIDTPWIRWEFQLRNDRAMAAVDHIINAENDLGGVVAAILNNYFRIIMHDDSNRSRCSVHPKWKLFLGAVGMLRLSQKKIPKTLEDKKNWIINQVLPTITGIIIADGGVFDIITEHWDSSIHRMHSDMLSLIDDALKARCDLDYPDQMPA